MALCPGLPGWASTRKVKPIWILLKQETVSGSGISWAICKSESRSRQITMPVHNQQCQSPEGTIPHYTTLWRYTNLFIITGLMFPTFATVIYRSICVEEWSRRRRQNPCPAYDQPRPVPRDSAQTGPGSHGLPGPWYDPAFPPECPHPNADSALETRHMFNMSTNYLLPVLRLHPLNGLFSRTTWVSRYQKGRISLDFNGSRDYGVSGWQWHQLDHMQNIT